MKLYIKTDQQSAGERCVRPSLDFEISQISPLARKFSSFPAPARQWRSPRDVLF